MKGLLNNSTNPSGHRNDHLNTIYFDNDLSHYYNDIQSYNVDDVQSYIKNDTLLRNNDSRRYDNNRSTQSKYASYHVYQRSADRNKVFLSGKDAIVFISVVKIKSIKWAVHIYAICLMDNHIHMLIKVRDKATLCRFVAEYTSLFTRIYNKRHNRNGILFSAPFGRSFKKTDKYIRNCISYINNNPVEANKTKTIEEYIWNLFSFGKTRYPHSEALDISKSRNRIRSYCRAIRADCERSHYVSYELLDEIFSNTDKKETKQLQDFILNTYNPLDYNATEALYGNLDKASIAINANTGAEYEIVEDDKD